jgi:hypothetical protein
MVSTMKYHLRYQIICLLSCIGLMVTVTIDNAWHRGIATTPTTQHIPYADQQYLGVNLFNIQYEPDPAVVTRSFATAHQLGARYARIQMPWEDVEIHGRGDFEDRRNPEHVRSAWEKYDAIVAEAMRHDIELIVRIDRPPAWARLRSAATPRFQAGIQENGDSTGPPDDYQDYVNFVATVVSRYPQLRYIQIWNEPNLAYEWNWELPNPVAFTELLTRTAATIRRINPQIVIVFPSLSPTDGKEPRIAPMSELDFLAQCYAAGAADAFDIMSAQAYGLGQPPDEHRYVRLRWHPLQPFHNLDRPIDTRIDVSRIVMLREVMERAGDAHTAVWVSEFGYNSAPDTIPAERRTLWGPPVSETQKGDYVVAQLARARQEWPWLGVMNLWMLRWGGPPADPANPTPYFAIIAPDFAPYAGFDIIKKAMRRPTIIGAGTYPWQHPAIQHIDARTWQVSFHGTQVAIRSSATDASVRIDDGEMQYLPVGNGETILARGLADTPHVLTYQSSVAPTTLLIWRTQPWRVFFEILPWLWVGLLTFCLVRIHVREVP